jgi:hypothetical protein
MISTLEIIDKLYMVLNVTDVTDVISGGVYKSKRPINSNAEDVVIGCLPTVNLQIQPAVANVNIHVPNLNIAGDNTQPNFARLRELTTLVISKLTDQYKGSYWFDVQSQGTYPEDEINQHYSNIRVQFFNNNL